MTRPNSALPPTPGRRRFPRWVYSGGDEPDPRFSLANERTFLAWIRTALALIAAGVAVAALPLDLGPRLRVVTAALFVLLGVVAAGQAFLGWARTERSMRRGNGLPGAAVSAVVSVGVLLAALLLAVGLFT